MKKIFDINCQACPRISDNLKQVKLKHPTYHCRPVPAFGSQRASLLVVGLGPGMHGANATGRPFTGDFAGILLYETLYEYGFASKSESVSTDDGLKLIDCRITNAVKCLPPDNKPLNEEVVTCNRYLAEELKLDKHAKVILALGGIAHKSILRACSLKQSDYPFSHNAAHKIDNKRILLDSYHCSRYNTQTKRLTTKMFRNVIRDARKMIYGKV